jgi:hypothetical protein
MVFRHFEDSSFSSRSYPIAIRCAWFDADRVSHVSDLVRSHLSWPSDWFRDSEEINGISHDAVELADYPYPPVSSSTKAVVGAIRQYPLNAASALV